MDVNDEIYKKKIKNRNRRGEEKNVSFLIYLRTGHGFRFRP